MIHSKVRGLLKAILMNDPDDSAADGVTVLEVWRKEAKEILYAKTCGCGLVDDVGVTCKDYPNCKGGN